MIASNMLKLGEIKEALYKEMRKEQMDAIENDRKLPRDFEQKVYENASPEIKRIQNEFQKLVQIKEVPQGTVPFFDPQGNISFVPRDPSAIQWAEQNGGRRIW